MVNCFCSLDMFRRRIFIGVLVFFFIIIKKNDGGLI